MKTAILILLFISTNVLAAQGPDVTKWSMRYLARASNALLVANDAAINNQPIMCGIKKSETQALSMNLKKIIDEKIKTLVPSQKEQIYKAAETCEADCTCDGYSLVLEAQSEKDPKAGKLMDLVNVKGKKLEAKDRMACVKSFKGFCNGSLLKALR